MTVMRAPVSLIAATVVALVGIAGLVRGAVPTGSSSSGASTTSDVPIQVYGAYVRQPTTADPGEAAAYFSITNNTSTADTLSTALTGAGATAALHTDTGTSMTLNAAGLHIPAHATVKLSPGVAHLMIQQLYGPVLAGQTVNIQLTFDHNGTVIVTAPVIGVTAPIPAGGHN